jgi:hypothetical protein
LGHPQFNGEEKGGEDDLPHLEKLLNVIEAYIWLSGKFE